MRLLIPFGRFRVFSSFRYELKDRQKEIPPTPLVGTYGLLRGNFLLRLNRKFIFFFPISEIGFDAVSTQIRAARGPEAEQRPE